MEKSNWNKIIGAIEGALAVKISVATMVILMIIHWIGVFFTALTTSGQLRELFDVLILKFK